MIAEVTSNSVQPVVTFTKSSEPPVEPGALFQVMVLSVHELVDPRYTSTPILTSVEYTLRVALVTEPKPLTATFR